MKKQIILVTGASSGIGKATAFQLLRDGHTVYVAARRLGQMDDLKAKGAIPLSMDITREEDILNVVARIEQDHGGLDVLVNNAGYAIYGSVEETTIEDARRQFEVNIFGLARLTQLFIPLMRRQQSGTIINITSVGGKIYTPMGAWYHATKHALEGWSDCLRLELKQFGIKVVIVEPGIIKTEFSDVMNQPMIDRSGKGPYAAMVKSVIAAGDRVYQRTFSPPEVIAKTISKAVRSSKPKTRYAAGALAKPMIFLRRWLSDGMFDRMVMSMSK